MALGSAGKEKIGILKLGRGQIPKVGNLKIAHTYLLSVSACLFGRNQFSFAKKHAT